jgi:hypothetical protein
MSVLNNAQVDGRQIVVAPYRSRVSDPNARKKPTPLRSPSAAGANESFGLILDLHKSATWMCALVLSLAALVHVLWHLTSITLMYHCERHANGAYWVIERLLLGARCPRHADFVQCALGPPSGSCPCVCYDMFTSSIKVWHPGISKICFHSTERFCSWMSLELSALRSCTLRRQRTGSKRFLHSEAWGLLVASWRWCRYGLHHALPCYCCIE